jgi:hypothetical protein
MATLDSSNITNGNTIETTDILQLYDAFTAGGGTTGAYSVSISGSLTGSASTATTATSASNITTAITGGGTHYLTFVEGAGTKAPKIASLLEYTPSNNNLVVTSSFATTASFALNASPTQLNSQAYSVIGTGPTDATFKFLAGKIKCSGGVGSTPNFPQIAGKTLGTNVFVTATILASSITAGNVVAVKAVSAGGSIDVVTDGGTGGEDVMFTAIYVP